MRLSPTTIGSLVALLALVLAPAIAAAAPCEGYLPVSFVHPAGGQIEVPLNTRVWVGEAWTDDGSVLELRHWPDIPVPTEQSHVIAGRDEITVLTPTEELVHAAYVVVAVRPDGTELELATFATGYSTDELPPGIPGLTGFEPLWDSGVLQDGSTFASIELRMPYTSTVMLVDVLDSDDGTADDDDSAGDDDDSAGDDDDSAGDDDDSAPTTPPLGFLDSEAVHGAVDGMIFKNGWPDYFEVGRTPCISNWPLAEPGAETQVRFAAFDRVGNFSGWGEWQTIGIPVEYEPITPEPTPPPEETCSVGGRSPASAWLAVVLLFAVLGLRRAASP